MRTASGTLCWLAALRTTDAVQARLSPDARRDRLVRHSTNLANLAGRRLSVLATSALWTEKPTGPREAAILAAVNVPAELWLGTRRWLATVAMGHVGATLVSQALVWRGIRRGVVDAKMRDTVDVGVSYGTAAVAGVLTYRIPQPWRRPYIAGCGALYVIPAARKKTFTDIGHLAGYALGLLARPRPPR